MVSRNIVLTLEKAREWYNCGGADLREVALQAYTKDELTIPEWKNIKTLRDACIALGIYDRSVSLHLGGVGETSYFDHLEAINKLDIIHKALNGDWKPSLVQGSVYYPYVRFYPAGQKAREVASSNNWKLGESFIADGKKYTLVGGGCFFYSCDGLAYFGYGDGDVQPNLGLLGCKSIEIAEHMSRYFSKEIFEATYAHHAGTYQWV